MLLATISVGQWFQIILLALITVCLYLLYFQIRKNYQQRQTEYIINSYNYLTSHKEMMEMYYKIEYDKFEYDDKFHQTDLEKKLDKLLNHFDNIAKLYEMKRIRFNDLKFIAYEYMMVYQNKSVQKYLNYLSVCFDARGLKVNPYWAFRRVGELLVAKFRAMP